MKSPWHNWVVGFFTLIWNGMGAMDYVLTVSRKDPYIARFTPERLVFLETFPTRALGSGALAVWLAVAGSLLLLLLRSQFAVQAFLAGLGFMILTTIHNLFLADVSAAQTASVGETAFTVVIFVLAVAQWLYRRTAIALIEKAVTVGARRVKACAELEISERTLRRWTKGGHAAQMVCRSAWQGQAFG